MSKARRWVIIVLSLAVLVMIGINMAEKDDTAQVVVNNNDPTYKSEHTDTLVYNPEGALSYRLIAQHVEYYSDQAVSWFTQPVLTTFDKDKIPTWSVKADKAKLTNDRMLYLYGHVEVNALVPDSQLRRITTDNAQINLVTQDVTSEDLVTLYGTTFNSSGLKMRGNLRLALLISIALWLHPVCPAPGVISRKLRALRHDRQQCASRNRRAGSTVDAHRPRRRLNPLFPLPASR